MIAYDRRGFGASPGPAARSLRTSIGDLAAVIEALDARPAALVGQSGAGPIVLGIAARRPELVRSIVLAEPASQIALCPSASASLTLLRVAYRAFLRRDVEGAAVGFYRWASARPDGNGYDPMPEQWKRVARSHADSVLRELAQLAVPVPLAREVRRVSHPVTLVITDGGRPVFRRTTRRVHRLLPDSRLVEIPGAGHLIPTDKPAEFGRVVASALGPGPTPTG